MVNDTGGGPGSAHSPERIVANLLSDFARTPPDIVEVFLGGHILHAQENLPYPRAQRRVLAEERRSTGT